MFGINSSNGKVDPKVFGDRGQAHLVAGANARLGGYGHTAEEGANVADHYCEDRRQGNPFNSAEANQIQQMNALRSRSVGGFSH